MSGLPIPSDLYSFQPGPLKSTMPESLRRMEVQSPPCMSASHHTDYFESSKFKSYLPLLEVASHELTGLSQQARRPESASTHR